jgi:hypothetical protein
MATKLQILQDHCRQFEEALTTCGSPLQAEEVRERICHQLGQSCKSEMMQLMLDEHARELIRQRFAGA